MPLLKPTDRLKGFRNQLRDMNPTLPFAPDPRKAFVALAQRHAVEAIAVIASIMNDTSQPSNLRLRAAGEILDRAYGKAVQAVDVKVEDKPAQPSNLVSLSGDQLLQLASILTHAEAEPPTIDVTPQEVDDAAEQG